MDESSVLELIDGELFGVWILIGAAMVLFMQCGFTMLEAGFTRAKNTANIVMKNLMDFAFGALAFIVIGYGLMFGDDIGGIIGTPNYDLFTDYENFDWATFIFNMMFCATTATIVAGAMAERTKFSAYCIYSIFLSAFVFPIGAHWVWGGGWLSQLDTPFHDMAGSGTIHLVGGVAALLGAYFLGPRIGKYERDENGKVVKVNAIPGYSLTMGALGTFILWFGWYGFNGGSASSVEQLSSIFVTSSLAPAAAAITCMIFTWVKYGKPDVSMCLNAALGGLAAVTAGCDAYNAVGALIVGAVSGVLVCFGVWFLDNKLHIDDPVGAAPVHLCNGVWGCLAVGLFATDSAPGNDINGLFYGGGWSQLGTQLIGTLALAAWSAVTMGLLFFVLKHTIGLRCSAEEEIRGLDVTEHNLSAAHEFMPSVATMATDSEDAKRHGITIDESEYVLKPTSGEKAKITKVSILCNPEKLGDVQAALAELGVNGLTVTNVMGFGAQHGYTSYYRGVKTEGTQLLQKVQVDAVVSRIPPQKVIDTVQNVLHTGEIGDGKIFVYDVEDVVKIRTGESGYDALQDTEGEGDAVSESVSASESASESSE